jgi:hypothetical protein
VTRRDVSFPAWLRAQRGRGEAVDVARGVVIAEQGRAGLPFDRFLRELKSRGWPATSLRCLVMAHSEWQAERALGAESS